MPTRGFSSGWSHAKVQYNFETWQEIKRKLILEHMDIYAQQGNVYGIFLVLDYNQWYFNAQSKAIVELIGMSRVNWVKKQF